MNIKSLSVAVSALVLSTSVNAAVISYDEVTYGDLSGDYLNPTNIGAVDTGINIISGTVHHAAYPNYDPDNFSFTVTSAHEVSSITANYAASPSSNLFWNSMRLVEILSDDTYSILANFRLGYSSYPTGTDILAYANLGPLGAGTYGIINASLQYYGSIDYSFNIQASQVPVPAAVWLFGSGLLGLVGVARRKSHS